MMYKLGAIILFLCTALQSAVAQLPSGATAPDFTVQDINGKSHHLYDLLNANKIVILEISATWCSPCWAYHQSHALQDFYSEHGPNGDGSAEVFWVEGDPNTNQACIYGQQGCNGNSAGNFTTNANYPIVSDASVAQSYQITYFPSIFIICPNKRSYEVAPVNSDLLWEKAQVCPVAYGTNNAGVFAHDPGYDLPEICEAVNLSPSFMLTNLGTTPLTSASMILKWNGMDVQTIDWQGFLTTYGEAEIKFDTLLVNAAGTLNTVISSINNNATDEDFANNYKNNTFFEAQQFDETRVVLKIKTDNYARELYWELRDDQNNVLEHGGNQFVGPNGGGQFPLGVNPGPGTYSSNTLIKDTLQLPAAGCYSIHFVDAFGDGMCCDFGNGYYKLYNINNPAIPLISSGQFEAYDRHAFSAGTLSANTEIATQTFDVQLYPNPAFDVLYLDIESLNDETLRFQVMNAQGQPVAEQHGKHIATGSNTLEMSLENLPQGLYFLTIRGEEWKGLPLTRKFMVRK